MRNHAPTLVATSYVRKTYARAPILYENENRVAHWQSAEDVIYAGEQFDRWLAARDAEVAARTLREALPDPASEFESLRRQALADAWDEGARRVVDWNKAYPLVMPTDNPYRDKPPTICPECAAGKPWNCDGSAWDHVADQPTTCDGKKN